MQETKQIASQINEPDDLWDLERYLPERRKDIDRKYDTRGSRLKDVLGRLLYENRLREEDLRGLREEKMKSIRSFAQFLRDGAA
jgi:photoprotection regulator FRP-like protein